MEIVIKIHEKDYQSMKNGHIPFSVLDAIKNGTPLPQGHGRLIDADKLIDSILTDRQSFYTQSEIFSAINGAPTIIESDKEGE